MPKTVTFLLVEDLPADVQLVEMEFRRAAPHIQLISVEDGGEAIDYLEGRGKYSDHSKYPLPSMILLDLKMPRVDGFEFLKWLRTEAPNSHRFTPVVVMSSSVLKEDIERAYELGANTYLVKPVNWILFKQRIRALGIYWAEHAQTISGPDY